MDTVKKPLPEAYKGLGYHELNAMLNLYGPNGEIQFEADREAAHQYFLQHVNNNTVFFHDLEEKLDYLVKNQYYERETLDQYTMNFIRELLTALTRRSSASRPSSVPSSSTPRTR